jgi:hypothetical protein
MSWAMGDSPLFRIILSVQLLKKEDQKEGIRGD